MKGLKSVNYWWFIFLLVAIILRFFSFFPSVLDHDESTYLIIGRDLIQGKSLYTDVTDTKPVGIFLIYAMFQWLFGYSIFLKRMMVALVVGYTSFLVSKTSEKLFGNYRAAIASGFIYLIYTSVWAYHGLSPNAELFFNLCTVGGLLLFMNEKRMGYFLGGLIIGLGFMIKYLVLFDFMAFMLFFFYLDIKGHELSLKKFFHFVFAGIGMVLPFIATNIHFYLNGNFNDFAFVTYQLPLLYKASPSIPRYFKMLGDLLLRFLPISYFFFYALFSKRSLINGEKRILFYMWIIAVLIAMYLPGKEFSHYTIQLMLPISLVAGQFFNTGFSIDRTSKKITQGKTGWALLIAVAILIETSAYLSCIHRPDQYKQVAGYLKKEMKKDDFVFVSNYEQIIYYLLEEDCPTKYIHSNILFTKLGDAFNLDKEKEVQHIIDRKPEFVIIQRKNEVVEQMIQGSYAPDTTFRKGEVKLFRHIH